MFSIFTNPDMKILEKKLGYLPFGSRLRYTSESD